jgi:hypothetical protein
MSLVATHTLGAALERDRLEHRVGRLEVAIIALRQRANEQRRGLGAAPRHLGLAIADFEAQVAVIHARLRELDAEPAQQRARPGP